MNKDKITNYKYFPENYEKDIDDLTNSTVSATEFTGLIPAINNDIDEQEAYDDIIEPRPPVLPIINNNY